MYTGYALRLLIGLIAGVFLVGPAAMAQDQDGDASSGYVPPGATAVMSHFGVCIQAVNHSQANAQYEWHDAVEWQGFVDNPDPDVQNLPCSCGSIPNGGISTSTVTNTESCAIPFPGPPPDTGTATRSETMTFTCEDGTLVPTGTSFGAWNFSGCQSAGCTDSSGTHANGATWSITSTNDEACSAAEGGSFTGVATETVTTSFECEDDSIVQIGQEVGPLDTAGCSCPTEIETVCAGNAFFETGADLTIFQWTQADITELREGSQQQYAWEAFLFESILQYGINTASCTCTVTPVPVGPTGQVSTYGPGAGATLYNTLQDAQANPVHLCPSLGPDSSFVCEYQENGGSLVK